jgi:hypothetical protein
MNTIESCRFTNSRVDLHAGAYVGCMFQRCELVFSGGPMHLENNTFRGCHWTFEGAAEATLKLLELLCRQDPKIAQDIALRLGLVSEQIH